jgi:putative SOS response-associated peptidase YedK
MCTRYALLQSDLRQALVRLGVAPPDPLPSSRYNIPPGTHLPAVRLGAAGVREFALLRWGLLPSWTREPANAPVNARAETLAAKPTFRDAYRRRRCLIPASGFYEWQTLGRAKQPWLFRRRDGAPFCFAGLWESWYPPDQDAPLETCAIVTTATNALLAPIHDRAPVILPPESWEAWLGPRPAAGDAGDPLLAPWAPETMTAVTVSPRMNSPRIDDAACWEPVEVHIEEQGELF